MTTTQARPTVQLRFRSEGLRCTLTIGPIRSELTDTLAREAEPCEGRCGAAVAPSDMSALGLLAAPSPDDGDLLERLTVPRGLWEAPRPDVDDDGDPVLATTHHDVERCRALAAGLCCTDHHDDGTCCDPADCDPCCPDCPTCPTLVRRREVTS